MHIDPMVSEVFIRNRQRRMRTLGRGDQPESKRCKQEEWSDEYPLRDTETVVTKEGTVIKVDSSTQSIQGDSLCCEPTETNPELPSDLDDLLEATREHAEKEEDCDPDEYIRRNFHRLPETLRRAIDASLFKSRIPTSFFYLTLESGK